MDKKQMRQDLDNFRIECKDENVTTRLKEIPFYGFVQLFNLEGIPETNFTIMISGHRNGGCYPCTIFGRHLVLKIVDELLDEGGD